MTAIHDGAGLSSESLSDEKFLVTGSEGCIGAWAVRNLALAGVNTVAADQAEPGFRLDKILDRTSVSTLVHERVDLREDGAIERIVKDHGITRIVHLAALQVPFVRANPLLGAEVNVVGTVRVLEAARASEGVVRGISYASSGAAAGPAEAVHAPETLYGVFKLINEHTARIYARDYGVSSIGLRPCIVYGPTRDQGMTSALTTALKAVVMETPYRIPFGGLVDLQFAQDVATAFIRSALADGDSGLSYDLHGDAITVADFVAAIEQVVPGAKDLITVALDPIPGNVLMDDTDLIGRIGALPKTSLVDGIRASIETFTAHRASGVLTANEPELVSA